MNALAIDSSTDLLSLAVRIGQTDFECGMDAEGSHSERILPFIDSIMRNLGARIQDIELIICGSGPGSFTGLRIGMSTAKGISFAAGIPLVFVPTLDAFAYGFDFFTGIVAPIADAKKARVYSALYRGGSRISEYLDISLSGLAEKLASSETVLFTGPDAVLAEPFALERSGWRIDRLARKSSGLALLDLGISRFHDLGQEEPEASPIYLRKSEADMGITIQRGVG